jgi:polygalacturonase
MRCPNMKNMTRRANGISRILPVLLGLGLLSLATEQVYGGWEQVPEILDRISVPTFPNRDFTVTDYGAVGNGQKDCTEAIRKAISAAHKAGGGRVVIPPGSFMTGPIHLKSNVDLHVSDGAVINFFVDPNKYLPAVLTRFEGIECMNYSPLVYAYEQQNIALTGKGILNGWASNENWWRWNRTFSLALKN